MFAEMCQLLPNPSLPIFWCLCINGFISTSRISLR